MHFPFMTGGTSYTARVLVDPTWPVGSKGGSSDDWILMPFIQEGLDRKGMNLENSELALCMKEGKEIKFGELTWVPESLFPEDVYQWLLHSSSEEKNGLKNFTCMAFLHKNVSTYPGVIEENFVFLLYIANVLFYKDKKEEQSVQDFYRSFSSAENNKISQMGNQTMEFMWKIFSNAEDVGFSEVSVDLIKELSSVKMTSELLVFLRKVYEGEGNKDIGYSLDDFFTYELIKIWKKNPILIEGIRGKLKTVCNVDNDLLFRNRPYYLSHLGIEMLRAFPDGEISSERCDYYKNIRSDKDGSFPRRISYASPYFIKQENLLSWKEKLNRMEDIKIMYQFSEKICNPNRYARSSKFIEHKKNIYSEINKNCGKLFPLLWEEVLIQHKESTRNALISLVNRYFFFSNERWKNLSDIYVDFQKNGMVTSENLSILYPVFYGNSVAPLLSDRPFLDAALASSLVFRPIFEDPKVKEIMGKTPQDINGEYTLAMGQNGFSFAWMKELGKNAQEAGALAYDFSLYTEGPLENQRIFIEFSDDGVGVREDNMHVFFIPSFTTKEGKNDDINFGWGFFTLFAYFDEVIVTSVQEGEATASVVYLRKKVDGTLELARTKQDTSSLIGRHGTKIIARRNRKVESPMEFALLKANYLLANYGGSEVKVTWNQELIESFAVDMSKATYLGKDYPSLLGAGVFDIFMSSQRGVFYKNRVHQTELDAYLDFLPSFMRTLEKQMTHPLGINMKGVLAQNANRTAFKAEKELIPLFSEKLQEVLPQAFAYEFSMNPKFFGLSYDYFYEFRFPSMVKNPSLEGWVRLDSEKALRDLVFQLPIAPNCFSHVELHNEIGKYLREQHVTDDRNEFSADSVFDPEGLLPHIKKKCGSEAIVPLLKKFSEEIQGKIERQKRQHMMAAFSSPDKKTLIEHPEFDVDHIPVDLSSRAQSLRKISTFTQGLIQDVFNKNIKIHYCYLANGAKAHTQRGASRLVLNLMNNKVTDQLETMTVDTFSLDALGELLNTVTHEMVHIEELPNEPTHDANFMRKQQVFLERLLLVTDQDILRWKERWKQAGGA